MRFTRSTFVCALTLTWLTTARLAHAQADEVTAAAQFNLGLAEMEAGRYEAACPALAESYRLDPKAGALFTLAECEAKWGRVASATAHYDDYVNKLARMTPQQRAVQAERERITMKQLEVLRPQVPHLTLALPVQASPTNLVIKRNGVVVGAPSLGVALPIDPGEHVIVVERADGGDTERTEVKVTIALGEHKRIELEVPRERVRPPTRAASTPSASTSEGSRKTLAFFAFGAAGVATIAGGITGALVIQKKSVIDEHCVGLACDAEGLSAANDASTLGAISTVSFIVAGVALAAGVVLLVTTPSKTRPTPTAATLTTAFW